jgi:hypothetical protein
MRATVMYGPGDVQVEERDEPRIVEATDAIIRCWPPGSSGRSGSSL